MILNYFSNHFLDLWVATFKCISSPKFCMYFLFPLYNLYIHPNVSLWYKSYKHSSPSNVLHYPLSSVKSKYFSSSFYLKFSWWWLWRRLSSGMLTGVSEAVSFSEMSLSIYQKTWNNIPEDSLLFSHAVLWILKVISRK